MRDDPQEQPPEDEETNSPASVIFMQMMRQMAADQEPEPPVNESTAPPVEEKTPPMTEEERHHAAAMEAQRVRRIQKRKERRRQQTVGTLGGYLRSMILVVITGGLIATILSWWTSPDALDTQLRQNLQQANAPTEVPVVLPTPNWLRRVGIVSGHRGPENDPGAVCPDGLTEASINFEVAQLIVVDLRSRGYSVDLLEEFDDRLDNYQGAALVSIHSNDCRDYGEFVSGFLVSQAEARPTGGEDERLMECIAEHYGTITGLDRRFGLTRDMTDYHIFRSISATTPGVIVELGFMLGDREILTTRPDLLARGVVDGILCYLEPLDTTNQNAEPEPEETPPVLVTPGV